MTLRRAVAVVALAAGLAAAGCREEARRQPEPVPKSAAEPAEAPSSVPDPAPRVAGRRAARVDREWVETARAAMGEPVAGECGPYRLVTDVESPGPRELCARIGSSLEAVYRERLGLEPVGEPAGVVLLFARREAFRRWASEEAGLRAGYAGFSRGARGLVALAADDDLLATTLAHELAHLVHRRALGVDIPPWLSEGLADAIGDAVGPAGLEELVGVRGVEGQARRLAGAYALPEPPRLGRLAELDRDEFDRAVPSFDYEQSALAVRMLLLEPDLAPGFRRFLADRAAGESYGARSLPRTLRVSWEELDRRLVAWLERELGRG